MMTQHALNAAAFTISILPVVLVFLLAQQRVVKGMTAGAVKGA
jgi:raffinose/stachyose/melibiose transport system permease protein